MIWVKYILKKHAYPRQDFPGSGGEFARHILDLSDLKNVTVETTQIGDHYDPVDKIIRLDEKNFKDYSLTAVVVAAHEVGHALQDRDNYIPLRIRTQLATVSMFGDFVAKVILFSIPFITYLSPRLALISFSSFIMIMCFRVILHLVTLPVEYDASFNRALPILEKGRYLSNDDLISAKAILNACAWTYVAATLFSIIDIIRWFRLGR